MDTSKEAAIRLLGVSRETAERLDLFLALLQRWSHRTNLISHRDFGHLWLRHVADSGQLLRIAPRATRWADIGSGAGFPGAVIGICLAGREDVSVHLIDRDRTKCAFLAAVSRETGAPLTIHWGDAAGILAGIGPLDVITSRATAPLRDLLDWSGNSIHAGATGLFIKGTRFREELTPLIGANRIELAVIPSLTNSAAAVIKATGAPTEPTPQPSGPDASSRSG